MSKEKELWEQTSYHLALKVAEQYQLKTVKQLQLNGRSWQSLATHFTIMLADKNTKQVSNRYILYIIFKYIVTVQVVLHYLYFSEGKHLLADLFQIC